MSTLSVWFDQYVDELRDYLTCCAPDDETAEQALRKLRGRLSRCGAQTERGFLGWAVREMAKEQFVSDIIEALHTFDLSVQDFLDSAYHVQRPPFPEFMVNNGTALISLIASDGSQQIWKLPEHWLTSAKQLWPVILRSRRAGKFYLAKAAKGRVLPVHSLFFGGIRDVLTARNGDFLDYTSDNIGLIYSPEQQTRFERSIVPFSQLRLPRDHDGNELPLESVLPARAPGGGLLTDFAVPTVTQRTAKQDADAVLADWIDKNESQAPVTEVQKLRHSWGISSLDCDL